MSTRPTGWKRAKLKMMYNDLTRVASRAEFKEDVEYYMRQADLVYRLLHGIEPEENNNAAPAAKRFYLRSKKDQSKILAGVGGFKLFKAVPYEHRDAYNVILAEDKQILEDLLYTPQGLLMSFFGIVPAFVIKNRYDIVEMEV